MIRKIRIDPEFEVVLNNIRKTFRIKYDTKLSYPKTTKIVARMVNNSNIMNVVQMPKKKKQIKMDVKL